MLSRQLAPRPIDLQLWTFQKFKVFFEIEAVKNEIFLKTWRKILINLYQDYILFTYFCCCKTYIVHYIWNSCKYSPSYVNSKCLTKTRLKKAARRVLQTRSQVRIHCMAFCNGNSQGCDSFLYTFPCLKILEILYWSKDFLQKWWHTTLLHSMLLQQGFLEELKYLLCIPSKAPCTLQETSRHGNWIGTQMLTFVNIFCMM